jgi:hypothetical protein
VTLTAIVQLAFAPTLPPASATLVPPALAVTVPAPQSSPRSVRPQR